MCGNEDIVHCVFQRSSETIQRGLGEMLAELIHTFLKRQSIAHLGINVSVSVILEIIPQTERKRGSWF